MTEFSRASLIARVQDKIDQTREEIDRVEGSLDDFSDEGNPERIEQARRALSDLETAVENLVP